MIRARRNWEGGASVDANQAMRTFACEPEARTALATVSGTQHIYDCNVVTYSDSGTAAQAREQLRTIASVVSPGAAQAGQTNAQAGTRTAC